MKNNTNLHILITRLFNGSLCFTHSLKPLQPENKHLKIHQQFAKSNTLQTILANLSLTKFNFRTFNHSAEQHSQKI